MLLGVMEEHLGLGGFVEAGGVDAGLVYAVGNRYSPNRSSKRCAMRSMESARPVESSTSTTAP